MNFQEVLNKSRPLVGPHCKACLICDGRACCNQIPGPGSKGSGRVATRNYEGWQDVFVNDIDSLWKNVQISNFCRTCGRGSHALQRPLFRSDVL